MKLRNVVSTESLHLLLNMSRVEHNPRRAWRAVQLARGAVRRHSWQKHSELAPFLALVLQSRPSCLVEIGLGAGGTLWALCQAASDNATIISVDLPAARHAPPVSQLEKLDVVASYAKPSQSLHFIQADSHCPETLARVKEVLPRAVDLLFIDGDHTYEAVAGDHALYAPLVVRGGMVAFHDILPHDNAPDCEVDRFWKELEGEKVEIISPSELSWGSRWGGGSA